MLQVIDNARNRLNEFVDYLIKFKYIKPVFVLIVVVVLVFSYFYSFQMTNIYTRFSTPTTISNSEQSTSFDTSRPHRLFCIILATPNSYKSNTPMVLLSTWVHKCDNYRFISQLPISLQARPIYNTTNRTDDGAGSFGNEIDEPLNILHPSGLYVDEYMRLSFKVFYSIREIYLKYWKEGYDGYDWYLKADLDTFV
jgi:hypothetical protein